MTVKREGIRRAATLGALFCLLFSFLASVSANAETPKPSDKVSNGNFTGIALLTDDPAWYKQFNRPETPSLKQVSQVLPGETGVIATLFSNPTVENGRVKIECTITANDADGSSTSYPPGVCYDGPARPPNVLYPSLLDLQFSVGENDPVGLAGFEIIMRDLNAKKEVKLTISFIQGQQNDS